MKLLRYLGCLKMRFDFQCFAKRYQLILSILYLLSDLADNTGRVFDPNNLQLMKIKFSELFIHFSLINLFYEFPYKFVDIRWVTNR